MFWFIVINCVCVRLFGTDGRAGDGDFGVSKDNWQTIFDLVATI